MDSNIWLIKTDSLGQEEWNQIFSYVGNSEGRSVQQTTDGGYIIAGMYSYLAILIKTDSLGNEEWHTSYFLQVLVLLGVHACNKQLIMVLYSQGIH
jgi:hypothetical protein